MSDQRLKVEFKGLVPHQGTEKHPGGQQLLIMLTFLFRFVIAAIGRQWGKTEGAKMAILEHFLSPRHQDQRFNAAFCAPTYKRCQEVFDEFVEMLEPKEKGSITPMLSNNRSELKIKLRPMAGSWFKGQKANKGGTVHFWSLEKPDNVRGPRMDFIVIDEVKDVIERAWVAVLKPMLLVRHGCALLIGTPSPEGVGFQWFKRLFLYGESDDPDHENYVSANFPSEGNPYTDPKTIEEDRREAREISPTYEKSEYDAQFVDDDAAVFERIGEAFTIPIRMEGSNECWDDRLEFDGRGQVRGEFLFGYDIGRHHDWAWITVHNRETGEQAYCWRGQEVPFRQQLEKLQEIRHTFCKPVVYGDDNGMGEAVCEDLAIAFGDGFVGRKWNKASKEADVTRGMQLFQGLRWKFLNWKVQKEAFLAFTRVKLPAGGYRYEAAAGFKDDPVTAALLYAHRIVFDYIPPPPPKKRLTIRDGPEYWEMREREREQTEKLAFWQ